MDAWQGVYFADLASKSATYCRYSSDDKCMLLLVSEVALGESLVLKSPDYEAREHARLYGKHSVRVLGRKYPSGSQEGPRQAAVPMGPIQEHVSASASNSASATAAAASASCASSSLAAVTAVPPVLPGRGDPLDQYVMGHNEYIVYDESQVRLCYLLRCVYD